MSTAVQEPVQETKALSLPAQAPADTSEPGVVDTSPLATMAIFIAISMGLAGVFVGLIAIWLFAIRDSGVMSVRM